MLSDQATTAAKSPEKNISESPVFQTLQFGSNPMPLDRGAVDTRQSVGMSQEGESASSTTQHQESSESVEMPGRIAQGPNSAGTHDDHDDMFQLDEVSCDKHQQYAFLHEKGQSLLVALYDSEKATIPTQIGEACAVFYSHFRSRLRLMHLKQCF